MVGGVVTAGIAAADYRYLVLQQQTAGTWCCSSRYQMLLLLLLLLLLWALLPLLRRLHTPRERPL